MIDVGTTGFSDIPQRTASPVKESDREAPLLATIPPSRGQRRTVRVFMLALVASVLLTWPFGSIQLLPLNSFVPALAAALFITYGVTAVLLFGQFSILRQRALLIIASGYVFSGVMVLAHALAFPGAFSPTGLNGAGLQSAVLIYSFWHEGLPIAVIWYALVKDNDRTISTSSTRLVIGSSVAAMVALGSTIFWSLTRYNELLPITYIDVQPLSFLRTRIGGVVDTAIASAALGVLWVRRRTLLDEWLLVAICAIVTELVLAAILTGGRFTVAWYAARLYQVVTATAVMVVLLSETSKLYANIARSNTVLQAVSGEMVPERLIDALMRLAIEHAGAERGLLLLSRGDDLRQEAEAMASVKGIIVHRRKDSAPPVPNSVVYHVTQAREAVTLDDASAHATFSSDPYVRARNAKSILCLPLMNEAEVTGVLYLENNLKPNVFTPDRVTVLRVLAAQAAISLENSRLYRDLANREGRIRRLVDANVLGICIWTLEGAIVTANDEFLRMLQYGREDVGSGRLRWIDLTPAEWHEWDERAVAELRSTGIYQPFEKEYFRKDGTRVPVLIGGALFEENGNEGVAFVLDLTERKRAEEMRRELEADLAHMNRVSMMGELAASLTHEILHPIATARNNARAAMRFLEIKPPELGEVSDALGCVVRDVDRARDIVRRIRDHIKKSPPRRERFILNEAVNEVIVMLRSPIARNGIAFSTHLSDGLAPVQGDRVQLQQVVANLILNAVEAMSSVENGVRELSISTEQREIDGILVAVQDSGPGIDQEDLERVFEPFYTTKTSGLGMGLSICRSIIIGHGGRLWASPNKPWGAVFQFTLPVVQEAS